MPVHKIPGGYQYGSTGKKYYGKDAKKRAERQALAIRLSGYKENDSIGSSSNFKNQAVIKNEPRKNRKTLSHEDNTASIGKIFVEKFFEKG